MTKTEAAETRKSNLAKLRKLVKRNSKIYTLTEHAKSNLRHWVRLFVTHKNELHEITSCMHWATNHPMDANRRYGLRFVGGNFSASNEAVNDLSTLLFNQWNLLVEVAL